MVLLPQQQGIEDKPPVYSLTFGTWITGSPLPLPLCSTARGFGGARSGDARWIVEKGSAGRPCVTRRRSRSWSLAGCQSRAESEPSQIGGGARFCSPPILAFLTLPFKIPKPCRGDGCEMGAGTGP